MKRLDLYWMSNREWFEFKGFVAVLKPDAPKEAQESYLRYLADIKNDRVLPHHEGTYMPKDGEKIPCNGGYKNQIILL